MAGKKPPKIAGDTEAGHCKKYKGQTDQEADGIHDENMSGFSQTLEDAGQGGVQIEKGTDEA